MTPAKKKRLPCWDRILFLDFDGVLHPTLDDVDGEDQPIATSLFGWLPLLASVLQPYPNVGVVVHSTWRYNHDLAELRELLGPLGERFLGATPLGPRYESILWWLHLNPAFTSHRILDDNAREFPNPPPAELIVCHPLRGVAEPAVLARLQQWLA